MNKTIVIIKAYLTIFLLFIVSGCSFLVGEPPALTPIVNKDCPLSPPFHDSSGNFYGDNKLVLTKEEKLKDDTYQYDYTKCRYSYVKFDGDRLGYFSYDTIPLYIFDGKQIIANYRGLGRDFNHDRSGKDDGYKNMLNVMEEKYSGEEPIRRAKEEKEKKKAFSVCSVTGAAIEKQYNIGRLYQIAGVYYHAGDDLCSCWLLYLRKNIYGQEKTISVFLPVNVHTGDYQLAIPSP